MAPLNNGSSTAQAAPEVRYQNPIFPIGNKARAGESRIPLKPPFLQGRTVENFRG